MRASRRCCGSCRTWRRGSSSRGKVLGRGEGVRTWERAADGSSTRSRERHKAPGRMLDPASCPDGGTNVRKTATRRVMVDSSPHAGNKCGSRFTSWSSGAPSPHAGNEYRQGRQEPGLWRPIPVCGERIAYPVWSCCVRSTHPRTQGTNHPKAEVVVGQVDPSPCAGNERPHHPPADVLERSIPVCGERTPAGRRNRSPRPIHPRVWGTNDWDL